MHLMEIESQVQKYSDFVPVLQEHCFALLRNYCKGSSINDVMQMWIIFNNPPLPLLSPLSVQEWTTPNRKIGLDIPIFVAFWRMQKKLYGSQY